MILNKIINERAATLSGVATLPEKNFPLKRAFRLREQVSPDSPSLCSLKPAGQALKVGRVDPQKRQVSPKPWSGGQYPAMRKIAVAMSKGGVGKTTTAVNVAAGLAARGYATLLIDTDTQGQAAKALGIAPVAGLAELMAREATPTEAITEARPGLYLLAGGQALAGTKREIARRDYGAEHMLSEALEPFSGRVAYAIVDTGPGWDSLLVNVLFYAEELLCPVSLEGLAVAGLVDFVQRIEAIRNYRQGLELRYILPTGLDKRTAQSGEIREQLESHFRGRVLEPIPYNVRLSEAATRGLSIWEYAPGSTGATAYGRLVDTLTEQEEREHGR